MKKQAQNNEPDFNSLLDVVKRFPTEASCREYLEKIRWNDQPVCVHCGSMGKIYRMGDGKTLKCSDCRKQFSVKIGTIFEDSPLPLQKWFFAMFLVTAHKKGISSLQLSRDIQVTQKTAWFMLHRIRHAIQTEAFKVPLKNTVEADETYIGGKNRGGKRGRGSENKTPVFGMIERKGELKVMPVSKVDSKTLCSIIDKNVEKGATMMTDDWKAYAKLSERYLHHVVHHGQKEYVRGGDIHVNTLEGFWSLLKRGILGIYHQISTKHLHRYCEEFEYRYNTRGNQDAERFQDTMTKCEGRLMYKTLIGA